MATTHTIPERGDATALPSRAKLLIMAGVLLGLFLEATDQTIVATALPAMVSEFQGLDMLGWVTTGYLLASTALVPVYGRLSDRYGRRAIVLCSISVFLLGSVLCGMAGSMLQLVLFRVVQGVGAAGLASTAFAVPADLYPPAERARATGLIGMTFGLASVVGPFLGGVLTDALGWRWIWGSRLAPAAFARNAVATVRYWAKRLLRPRDQCKLPCRVRQYHMHSGADASQPEGLHTPDTPGGAGPQSVEPLTLLRQLFRAVPNVPRFDLLLEQLLRASVHTLGATCAAFWRFDWAAQTRSVVMSYAAGEILRDQLWPGAGAAGTTSIRDWPGLAALRATPALLQLADADATQDGQARAIWPLIHPGGAMLLVPVVVGDDLAGCLTYHQPQAPFSDKQLAVAQESAGHVSLAISVTALAERGERLATLEERQRQLEAQAAHSAERNAAFQRSLAALTDDPDLDAFLGYTLYDIAEQLGATMGDIFLFDPATDTLAPGVALRDGQILPRVPADEPAPLQQPFSAAITPAFAELCRARALLLLSDERYDLLWPGMAEWHRAQGNHKALAVALVAGEQPLGVLGLAFRDPAPLNADQRQAIQIAANQATLAIQLSQLAGRSRVAAMLEERTRLAREIHDTLAQGLTGIIVHLQAATNPHTTDPGDRAAHLEAALALARHSLTKARRSVQALRPSDLAQADLAGALGGLVQRLRAQAKAVIDYSADGAPAPLADAAGAELLRIAQEALANALAHAAATHISVALTFERGQLRLLIADDGRGFEPAAVPEGHFGLVGMRERAQRIGATCVIRSAPGQGCSVSVTLLLAGGGQERSTA